MLIRNVVAKPCDQRFNVEMEFSEKVALLLKSMRRTQADMARVMGVHQQQVNDWVKKNSPPGKHVHLISMARYLGTTIEYLIDPSQEDPNRPGLDEQETMLLQNAKLIGYDRALRRLLHLEEESTGKDLSSSEVTVEEERHQDPEPGIKKPRRKAGRD